MTCEKDGSNGLVLGGERIVQGDIMRITLPRSLRTEHNCAYQIPYDSVILLRHVSSSSRLPPKSLVTISGYRSPSHYWRG
jgi:hypothetical protein